MSESRTTYNGWSNYETWNLALWLGNDQGSDSYWRERAEDAWRDADDKEDATTALAGELEQQTQDGAPEVSGFYSDILSAALREVNYYEIAEHWIDDAATDNPKDNGDIGEDDDDDDSNDAIRKRLESM